MGRPLGWAGTLSPRWAGDGLPPGLWFLLGFRVCDEPVAGNIVQVFCFGQGVRVTFGGMDFAPVWLGRTVPTGKGVPARRGGAPSEGWVHAWAHLIQYCLRRNDGGAAGGRGVGEAITWYCSYAGSPPLILREPQHERPLPWGWLHAVGRIFQRRTDQHLRPARGTGMTGGTRVALTGHISRIGGRDHPDGTGGTWVTVRPRTS